MDMGVFSLDTHHYLDQKYVAYKILNGSFNSVLNQKKRLPPLCGNQMKPVLF